jgi:hypothetical protein
MVLIQVQSKNTSYEIIPMTAIIVNTGRVLPQEMALRLDHFVYKLLGVPERNLYSTVKMMNPTTCDSTPDETVNP